MENPPFFDSHVHWRATGEWGRRLDLKLLRSSEDVVLLNPRSENFVGDWLLGFGWDQNKFKGKAFPEARDLDQKFPRTPVYFLRADGHAAWVNSEALRRSGLLASAEVSLSQGKILRNSNGTPTGILLELAMGLIEQHIPRADAFTVEQDLLAGQEIFLLGGFHHIRDLTCDNLQWEVACHLSERSKIKLYVDQFLSVERIDDFDERVRFVLSARKQAPPRIQPMGVKVFLDGALGSEGAWLSREYSSGSGCGLQLISEKDLSSMMKICFERNVDLAIHVIGDEAAHCATRVAHQLKEQGVLPTLHYEHAELLRPETITLMRELRVTCHMQPSHWLSDKTWLGEKIGPLVQHAFRWRALQAAGIPVFFGSDSPIEPSQLALTEKALKDAAENHIPAPEGDWKLFHIHPRRQY